MRIIEKKDGAKYIFDTKTNEKIPVNKDEIIDNLIVDNLLQAEIIDSLLVSILDLESKVGGI